MYIDNINEKLEKKKAELSRRKRRGYSIVEIGLVLIIVALLISAVIVAFYTINTNAKQGQVTNLVNETYSAVQDLHRSATSYGPDGTNLIPLLEAAEMVPPIGRRADGTNVTIVTPFGEPVEVVAGGAVGAVGQSFTINLNDYTKANCVDFMSNYVDRTVEQSGLIGARSGGTAFTFPLTVQAITTSCVTGDLELEYR